MARPTRLRHAFSLLIVLLLAFAARASEIERYSVLIAGNPAGSMEFEQKDATRVSATWSFNDRGRGPDVSAQWRLDKVGWPTKLDISGVDYMKSPVSESFERMVGKGSWKSAADSGTSAELGYYISLDGPPAELWLLATALGNAPDNRIPLLPSGSAHLVLAGQHTLKGGLKLDQLEIEGLSMEPQTLWLDQDGRFFAIADSWFSVIREGQEDLADELIALQRTREKQRFQAITDAAVTRPDRPVLIDNARIFDVAKGTASSANAVLIVGPKIEMLLQPGDTRPTDVVTIDAKGRTLLPGLWDMHTHLSMGSMPLHLAAGVTTVRDLANDMDQLNDIINAVSSGKAPGPHVLRAGIIDAAGPFAAPTKARIDTLEQGLEWVDTYAKAGYQQIKIYSSMPPEFVPALAKRAHEKGMRVSGHIPAGMWADQAVEAGFDEIQHINMVFLNFYRDIVETRNRDRFIKVAERGADLKPDSAPFVTFTELLKQHRTVVDPTVAVFLDLFNHSPGELAPSLHTAKGRLPPLVARQELKGGLEVPAGWEQRYQDSSRKLLEVVNALYKAGVTLVAGTDGMAGFTYQAELGYYQDAGIPAPAILRLATLGSAEVMGLQNRVGQIAPGQRADLILVDGKPDEDIKQIEQVDWVMKDGEMVDPAALYKALAIAPKPDGP